MTSVLLSTLNEHILIIKKKNFLNYYELHILIRFDNELRPIDSQIIKKIKTSNPYSKNYKNT